MNNAPVVVAAAVAVPSTDSAMFPSSTPVDQGGQIITPAPLKVVSPTHSGTQSPILTSTINPITSTTTTNNNTITTIMNNNLSSNANSDPINFNTTSASSSDEPSSEVMAIEYVEGDRVEVLYEANGEFYPAVVTMRIDAAYTGEE